MVFQEIAPAQSHKIKNRNDLESELFGDSDSIVGASEIRDNEGEAAEYGVYFDDTDYDYMQHLRDLGNGAINGESYFVEASVKRKGEKGKQKMSLEDALREASISDLEGQKVTTNSAAGKGPLLSEDVLPSKNLTETTYQDQQDVPNALAGFQPDMDPRLREILIALEDEAYVDDEEDVFNELTKDHKEVTLEEFEDQDFADQAVEEGDGWETDDTAKPQKEYKESVKAGLVANEDVTMEDPIDHGDGDWMKEFSKFKTAEKTKSAGRKAPNPDLQSSIMTGTSATGGRRKRRKGAMTSSTGYSMTSSSLFRTEGQTLLDARFDKIEEDYADDGIDDLDGSASVMTGGSIASKFSTVSSQAPSLRSDFDGIMDEFLGGYSMKGKKRLKKGGYQTGMEQLDEIRKGLGPARIARQKA